MELNLSTINKWVPFKLLQDGSGLHCEWLYTGDEQFKEAFFERTISKCRRLLQNKGPQKTITGIDKLDEYAAMVSVDEPAAIVFHVSRCGSTIVSQAFANSTNSIVLSEVPFFDDVLQLNTTSEYDKTSLLKNTIKLYSQQKSADGGKVFIKTDSWHIMHYALLRQVFPSVPFILLYRNPAEVVMSLNKSPGRHCVPQFIDPVFLGIQTPVITAEDFYNYPVKVIEKYMEGFITITAKDDNAYLFNYKEGMPQVIQHIFNTIGLAFTDYDRQQLQQRLAYHSKNPGAYFSPEPELQSNDDKFLYVLKLYNQLEGIRLNTQKD